MASNSAINNYSDLRDQLLNVHEPTLPQFATPRVLRQANTGSSVLKYYAAREFPMQDPVQIDENFAAPTGFSREEMLACPKCGKPNAPTRGSCLYCAAGIENPVAKGGSGKLDLSSPDAHEEGISVIILPGAAGQARSAAAVLGRNVDEIGQIAATAVPFPVARLRTRELAAELGGHLTRFGFMCSTLADSELDIRNAPWRIRGIEFTTDLLRMLDFNTTAVFEVAVDEVRLLVAGRHAVSRSTTSEHLKRGKNNAKKPDESKEQRDEKILDIYVAGDERGFRIRTSGFDFSCLGEAKTMFANDNIELLADRIARIRPGIVLDKGYDDLRHLLDAVWEPDFHREAQGLHRSGLGRLSRQASDVFDNLNQFTKYSRMRNKLL